MTFFVASGTVILFLHVFSDYKGGDDISLHPAPLFSSCMSFLTTKEGMTFRCIRHRYSLLACLFRLQRRGWHFVASGTVILFLHVFSDYTGGDDILLRLRKELVVLSCWLLGIGKTWHKKWISEDRHSSHSSILDLYVCFTGCILWNAYDEMKMMVYCTLILIEF